jgi:hypothetical protein
VPSLTTAFWGLDRTNRNAWPGTAEAPAGTCTVMVFGAVSPALQVNVPEVGR